VRIFSCPDEPSCVNIEHLRRDESQHEVGPAARTMYGNGTLTESGPNSWKVGVSAGHDDAGNRRCVLRTVR